MKKMDVLICASETDVNNLLEFTLQSVIQKFEPLGCIYIVTNAKQQVELLVQNAQRFGAPQIVTLGDEDILSDKEMHLEGWIRQQIIKLRVDTFTHTENICIIGADTILLQKITRDDLMLHGKPIVYFNRDTYPSIHLEYERARLVKMSRILHVVPEKSYLLGNFIMELMVFNRSYLRGLRDYLEKLYSEDYFLKITPRSTKTLLEKLNFSEWALYCIYLLDVLNEPAQVRLSTGRYMAHIHSANYYKRFRYDAKIVHFVAKDLDIEDIKTKISVILGG